VGQPLLLLLLQSCQARALRQRRLVPLTQSNSDASNASAN
jgi:hypothetical protein